MFLCSFTMGLRPKEVYNALICNINLKKRLWFIPAEDNKQRFSDYMPIPIFVIKSLKQYKIKLKRLYPKSKYMFPTCNNKPIDRSVYCKIFRNTLKECGLYYVKSINKQNHFLSYYNSYSCRHTFATFASLKLDGNLKKLAILLRHKDQAMRTTSLYVHCVEDLLRPKIMKELYKT